MNMFFKNTQTDAMPRSINKALIYLLAPGTNQWKYAKKKPQ